MTSVLLNSDTIQATQPETQNTTLPAVETLHALYAPRIYRFLLGHLRDRDLAESLTQDTFIRAWTAREQFRGDCAPATWLTRIALNLLRDQTRTNRFQFWKRVANTAIDAQEMAGQLPHRVTSAQDSLIAHQQMQQIWQSVEELSERQRTVFLLRFVEEMELTEIAAATSLPISTVKTHLYRALAIVRAKHQETK